MYTVFCTIFLLLHLQAGSVMAMDNCHPELQTLTIILTCGRYLKSYVSALVVLQNRSRPLCRQTDTWACCVIFIWYLLCLWCMLDPGYISQPCTFPQSARGGQEVTCGLHTLTSGIHSYLHLEDSDHWTSHRPSLTVICICYLHLPAPTA